jgi:hypothetical protein
MALIDGRVLFARVQADAAGHPEGSLAVVEQDSHHVRGDVG